MQGIPTVAAVLRTLELQQQGIVLQALEVLANTAHTWLVTHVLPHEAALRGFLGRLLPIASDVADVIQDTYARLLLLNEAERNAIVSPRAYVFRIAQNLALDRLRRRQRTVSLDALPESTRIDVLGTSPQPDEELISLQERELLARAVASLPERCRQVVTLRKIHGLSQKEIASRLGIAEHTVEKHVATGVRLVAKFMKDAESKR